MNLFLESVSINSYLNSYYIIEDNHGYLFDSNKNFIRESNDACYLFNGQCHPPSLQHNIKDIQIDEKIIPFICHFHTGVHAYSGVYSILKEFLSHNDKNFDGFKIAVYENVQNGILEILYEFFDGSEIIKLKPNILYKFSEIKLIPNSLHSFLENHEMSLQISNLIFDKIKLPSNVEYPKKIAIIKTFNDSITSTLGSISSSSAEKYCENNGYTLLNPSLLGEVRLFNYINNCEEILFSWGTTFMKNFIYISDKCKKSKVLVFGDEFIYEYHIAIKRDIIVKQYRNCVFEYLISPQI